MTENGDKDWKDLDNGTSYYYNIKDGLVVGQVFNLAHTKIYAGKIPVSATEEILLGQFITFEFAKRAVENYWYAQSRTLIE